MVLFPYQHRTSLGRLDVSGRCPPAASAAFRHVPDTAFYDLGSGEDLPAELCASSARSRLAVGTVVGIATVGFILALRNKRLRPPM